MNKGLSAICDHCQRKPVAELNPMALVYLSTKYSEIGEKRNLSRPGRKLRIQPFTPTVLEKLQILNP